MTLNSRYFMDLKQRYEAACEWLVRDIRPLLASVIAVSDVRSLIQDYTPSEFDFENALYGITKDVELAEPIAALLRADVRFLVKDWTKRALVHLRKHSDRRGWSIEYETGHILRWAMMSLRCARIWCFYTGCTCGHPLV